MTNTEIDLATRMTVEFQRLSGFHELIGSGGLDDAAVATLLGTDTGTLQQLRTEMRAVVAEGAKQLLAQPNVRVAIENLPRDYSIAVVGDSQSAGHQSWAEMLSEMLSQIRPDVELLNLAKSGDTTMDLVRRLGLALGERRPALYIVFIGGNDFCRTAPQPGPTFISDEQTRSNLQRIADIVAARGGRLAWVPPAPVRDEVVAEFPVFQAMGITYTSADSATKAELFRERPEQLVDLWTTFTPRRLPELLSQDGLHLSPAGHRATAERIILEVLGDVGERGRSAAAYDGKPKRRLRCPCGELLVAADDEALIVLAREHLAAQHPGTGAEYTREQILFMAY
ncbi:MAG: acyl-CoA thioesterase [Pseudonocardiales bacterium]|nr:acyl-CoA thioesterase [Pseudonocardiales bacterium]